MRWMNLISLKHYLKCNTHVKNVTHTNVKTALWRDAKYANFCPSAILQQAAEPRKAL